MYLRDFFLNPYKYIVLTYFFFLEFRGKQEHFLLTPTLQRPIWSYSNLRGTDPAGPHLQLPSGREATKLFPGVLSVSIIGGLVEIQLLGLYQSSASEVTICVSFVVFETPLNEVPMG